MPEAMLAGVVPDQYAGRVVEFRPRIAGQDGDVENPTIRGRMAGQITSRVDDTVLIREAQNGNRAAFE